MAWVFLASFSLYMFLALIPAMHRLISFAGWAWLVFFCPFHIFFGYIWQFMAISAHYWLFRALYDFFDHMFLALIPSMHSTYHLPLLAINGIIFGLHYARY